MSNSVSSRRKPWPYHLMLNTHGLMLHEGPEGTLIGTKTQTLENVAPTVQDYSSAPVYKERTFAFKPTSGMGERVQSSHTSRRYRYALNAQFVGDLFGKGPLTHTLTPAQTGSIRDFVEGLHGGVQTQFILAGAFVLRRSGDTNGTQTSSDNRIGQVATSGVRFKGSYVTPVDGLYVAWDDGVLREYNGATWASATLPAGFLPQYLETVGDELWGADPTNNVVRKCTGDPKLAASWSGPITPGQGGSGVITALRAANSLLFIFKSDGSVITLNGDGTDNDLFPGLRVTPSLTNGRTAASWLDSIWFRMDQAFYRLSASGEVQLTPIGPDRLRENDSEVRGPVQAFAGWGAIVGYAATLSGSDSYLWSYGDWNLPESGEARFVFVDQWDGALVKWTGRTVTAMRTSNIATDSRLYVGFADGTWDWIKLVVNPFAANSGAEFTAASSKVYVPLHHGMFQADYKAYRGFSAFGPVLSATDYAQVAYRTDTNAAYASLGGSFTTTGQRLDTPEGTAGKIIDVEISLVNTTSADSPVLEGLAIHESVRPAFQLDFSGIVRAETNAAKLDGSSDRKTAEQIRELMKQAAGAPGSVTMTMPDEVAQGFSFFGYRETLRNKKNRRGLAWDIAFQATEFRTQTVYGTVDRLGPYAIDDLGGFSVDDLGLL